MLLFSGWLGMRKRFNGLTSYHCLQNQKRRYKSITPPVYHRWLLTTSFFASALNLLQIMSLLGLMIYTGHNIPSCNFIYMLWQVEKILKQKDESDKGRADPSQGQGQGQGQIVVKQSHLVAAASQMKPSVSVTERFRYQQMWVFFVDLQDVFSYTRTSQSSWWLLFVA